MYNLSAFDSWWRKTLGWLSSRFYIVLFAWGIILYAAYNSNSLLLFAAVLIAGLPSTIFCWFISWAHTPVSQFRRMNNLDNYFSGRHNTWSVVGPQYTSMKRSGILTRASYGKYGTNLLGVEVSGVMLPVAFMGVSACTTWIKLQRNFPHTIIDSQKDNKSLAKTHSADGEKLDEITLEGNFPANFKVYQEANQQLLTLQILTPDRMAYLVDKLGDFNIEIHDNYLRLYSANAQKSSMHFRAFLDAIENLQVGFKVSRLNKIC